MTKEKVLKAIENYKAVYTNTAKQIETVKQSQELTTQGKVAKIGQIENAQDSKLADARAKVINAINDLIANLEQTRRKAVEIGLQDADRINLVVDGINHEAYDIDMLKDMIDAFQGNTVALARIKSALENNEDLKYHALAIEIETDKSNKVIANLEKIKTLLETEPKISFTANQENDITSQLYLSGATFDNWSTYITDNVA